MKQAAKHSRIPKGIRLRIRLIKEKHVILCHSPESYIEKFKKLKQNKVLFSFSHNISIVEQMIL